MSDKELSFDLTSQSVVPLTKVFKDKDCVLAAYSHEFRVNRDLSVFLSIPIYRHFLETKQDDAACEPYSIEIDGQELDANGFTQDEVLSCLGKLVSLIGEAASIKVSQREAQCIAFIAGQIENLALRNDFLQMSSAEEVNLTLRSKTLSPFRKLPSAKEFGFLVCGKRFECPKVLASFLSSKVAKGISDPSFSQLELTPPPKFTNAEFLSQFQAVFLLISGNTLKLTPENCMLTLSISLEIDNDELTAAISSHFLKFSSENIADSVNYLRDFSIFSEFPQMNDVIQICASNFYRIELNNLQAVALPILTKILSSPQLKAKDEAQIFGFVQGVIATQGMKAAALLQLIRYKFLSSEYMKDFLKAFKFDNFTSDIWDSLSERLCCEVDAEIADSQRWNSQNPSQIRQKVTDLQKENDELKAEVKNLKKEVRVLKGEKPEEEAPLKISGDTVLGLNSADFNGPIAIPDGLRKINSGAFKGTKISSLLIPDSVIEIGKEAFEDCDSLKSVQFSNGLEKIGECAFQGCGSLADAAVPPKVTDIKESTFSGCQSLRSVSISKSVKSIGKTAFEGCASLSEVLIPSSVNEIQDGAFYDCQSLKSINIPDGVKSIGEGAFYGCASLSRISVPDSLSEIKAFAFNECSSLAEISIPDAVKVDDSAFSSCPAKVIRH